MKKLVVGVLAHVDAGKTTLCEGLLYCSGQIKKQGRAAYVFSASEANTRFYQNSGFETVAVFRECFIH